MANKYESLERLLEEKKGVAGLESHALAEVNRIIADIKEASVELDENYGAFNKTYLTTSERLNEKNGFYMQMLNSNSYSILLNMLAAEMNDARLLVIEKEKNRLLSFMYSPQLYLEPEDLKDEEETKKVYSIRNYSIRKMNKLTDRYPILNDILNRALLNKKAMSGAYNRRVGDEFETFSKIESACMFVIMEDTNMFGLKNFMYLTTPELLEKVSPKLFKYVMQLDGKPIDTDGKQIHTYLRSMHGPLMVYNEKGNEIITIGISNDRSNPKIEIMHEEIQNIKHHIFGKILAEQNPGAVVEINEKRDDSMYA